jgi:hypothetical protein
MASQEEDVDVPALRHSLPSLRSAWQFIPLDDRNLIEVHGQCARRKQASHTGAGNNGTTEWILVHGNLPQATSTEQA